MITFLLFVQSLIKLSIFRNNYGRRNYPKFYYYLYIYHINLDYYSNYLSELMFLRDYRYNVKTYFH